MSLFGKKIEVSVTLFVFPCVCRSWYHNFIYITCCWHSSSPGSYFYVVQETVENSLLVVWCQGELEKTSRTKWRKAPAEPGIYLWCVRGLQQSWGGKTLGPYNTEGKAGERAWPEAVYVSSRLHSWRGPGRRNNWENQQLQQDLDHPQSSLPQQRLVRVRGQNGSHEDGQGKAGLLGHRHL